MELCSLLIHLHVCRGLHVSLSAHCWFRILSLHHCYNERDHLGRHSFLVELWLKSMSHCCCIHCWVSQVDYIDLLCQYIACDPFLIYTHHFNSEPSYSMLSVSIKSARCQSSHHCQCCSPLRLRLHSLPNSIKYLDFGDRFNQPLLPGALPPDITHLMLGKDFTQHLQADVLPASLQELWIWRDYAHDLSFVPLHIIRHYNWDGPECWWNSW